MLEYVKKENVLFLDIETVPASPDFNSLDEDFKLLWEKKSAYFRKEEDSLEDSYGRAGIYAEFGKIVCISVGLIIHREGKPFFRLKSFAGDDEKQLLLEFAEMLEKFSSKGDVYLSAHNGKEFDFPYIARRMLVNGIKLPNIIDVAGKKPWEVKFLDTMELWKFGDYKHFTSLNLLTKIFDIPSPKGDIDGSQVGAVYWQDKDLNRIVSYCERDVLAVAQLFLRFKGEPLIPEGQLEVTGQE